MSKLEENRKAKELLNCIDTGVNLIWKELNIEITDADSPKVYDLTYKLYEKVESLLDYLESIDKNLQVEGHNLGSVDDYFKDNPVTDYIKASIDYISSQSDAEREEARKSLEEAIDKVQEYQDKEGIGCTNNPEACNLIPCFCEECVEKVQEDEKGFDPEDEEKDSSDELLEYIQDLDEDYYTEVNEIMDDIEEMLEGKKTLSDKDLELVRYYLKNLPYNNEDVDSLSDNALTLAFKYRAFRK